MIRILSAALHVVLRRDMSLNRRLYAWLLGEILMLHTQTACHPSLLFLSQLLMIWYSLVMFCLCLHISKQIHYRSKVVVHNIFFMLFKVVSYVPQVCFYFNIFRLFLWSRTIFKQSLLQASVLHEPLEINLICWFGAQVTFLIIINIKNSCCLIYLWNFFRTFWWI